MWLLILTIIGGVALVVLITGLLKAGQRADEGEEKILKFLIPPGSDGKTMPAAPAVNVNVNKAVGSVK